MRFDFLDWMDLTMRMTLNVRRGWAAALAAVVVWAGVACSERAKDTHPQQWVSKRQAAFKELTRLLEPIGLHARGRTPLASAELRDQAQQLAQASRKPWPLFPADSNYPPTRAKPALWMEPAAFKTEQDAFQLRVDALAQVAAGNDPQALLGAVDAVEKACKNCHNLYRSER